MPVPPKHPSERRRRNATLPMTQLPAGGRRGPAPPWPLSPETSREEELWAEIWRTPMAAAWERLGWHRHVARYVRVAVEAEEHEARTAALVEARQLEDRLGLNPVAMLKLRWEVAADEVAEARATRPTSRPEAVDPTAASG